MTRNILYNGALVLLALIVLAGTGGPAAAQHHENGDLSLDRVLLVIDSYELQVPLQDLTEDQDGGSTLTWCY